MIWFWLYYCAVCWIVEARHVVEHTPRIINWNFSHRSPEFRVALYLFLSVLFVLIAPITLPVVGVYYTIEILRGRR
jgi:hypothetical protein